MNGHSPPYAQRENTVESTATFSTATMRGGSIAREISADVEMPEAGAISDDLTSEKCFIVAIDFGTTFSSVSFIALPKDNRTDDTSNPKIYANRIQNITNYAGEPRNGLKDRRMEVPTEIWYPKKAYLDRALLQDRHRSSDFIENGINGDSIQHGDQDPNDDVDMETDDDVDDEDSKETFWGYDVQRQLQFPDTNRNQNRRLSRFKLLLDESEFTKQVRLDLEPNWKELQQKKIIKDKEDVIADYLKYLFTHTREQLIKLHDFSDDCQVEFVLCVPPVWTPKACRIMQSNMEKAIRESGFGSTKNNSIDNLFIVSEPEAAAAYVLASTTAVLLSETFVLIDAGGGTVDATTYTVDNVYPLRLDAEGVEVGGALCGSSYLNEAFRKHIRTRLNGENYLEVNDLTIESIIDALELIFENERKRAIDVVAANTPAELFYIQGLRPNSHPDKRLHRNRLKLDRDDLNEIFLPLLEEVTVLMKVQLTRAKEKGINVEKVILIGGFAESPSLQSYLRRELAAMQSHSRSRDGIRLIVPTAAEIAVSSGAVLRALNKTNGPKRFSLSSYGFLCDEEHDPEIFPAHRGVHPYSEPVDGRKYLKRTIAWLIKQGDLIPSEQEYPVRVYYVFDAKKGTRFECHEELWVADTRMESHYRLTHEKNKNATRVGTIEFDLTFLKERNLIQAVEPEEDEAGKRHYKVEFELVMIVNGRNMRWEARYPVGGEVQSSGQVSIAAAFKPGTK